MTLTTPLVDLLSTEETQRLGWTWSGVARGLPHRSGLPWTPAHSPHPRVSPSDAYMCPGALLIASYDCERRRVFIQRTLTVEGQHLPLIAVDPRATLHQLHDLIRHLQADIHPTPQGDQT